jgi:hypothetical protein
MSWAGPDRPFTIPPRHNGQPCGPNPNAKSYKDVRYDA